jgi:hypothetical protein
MLRELGFATTPTTAASAAIDSAPQLGLVVDDRPADEVQRHGAGAEGHLKQEGGGEVGSLRRLARPDQPPHPPVQLGARQQQHREGEQHGDLGEAAVELVGHREHREPKQGRHEPEVRVGAPVDPEALQADLRGVDVEPAVEKGPTLHVEERAEHALVAHHRGARTGQHPEVDGDGHERAQQRGPAKPAACRGGLVVRRGLVGAAITDRVHAGSIESACDPLG